MASLSHTPAIRWPVASRGRAQDWAVDSLRASHTEALLGHGEWTLFLLRWHIADYEAGLVNRCPTCQGYPGDTEDWVDDAYQQVDEADCPDCLGTTFEGGLKAVLVRPAFWSTEQVTEESTARGEVRRSTATLQTTHDFRMRLGDWAITADDRRWGMRTVDRQKIVTGPMGTPGHVPTVAYFYQMELEPRDDVAYKALPDYDVAELDISPHRRLVDFSGVEFINGPLYP